MLVYIDWTSWSEIWTWQLLRPSELCRAALGWAEEPQGGGLLPTPRRSGRACSAPRAFVLRRCERRVQDGEETALPALSEPLGLTAAQAWILMRCRTGDLRCAIVPVASVGESLISLACVAKMLSTSRSPFFTPKD